MAKAMQLAGLVLDVGNKQTCNLYSVICKYFQGEIVRSHEQFWYGKLYSVTDGPLFRLLDPFHVSRVLSDLLVPWDTGQMLSNKSSPSGLVPNSGPELVQVTLWPVVVVPSENKRTASIRGSPGLSAEKELLVNNLFDITGGVFLLPPPR